MRIDKFLKISRIIKRRTLAKEACDQGKVSINGQTVKAGAEVKIGDRIRLAFGDRVHEVEVLSIDEKVKKEDAISLYRKISSEEE